MEQQAPRSFILGELFQLLALLKKNFLLSLRNWKSTILIVLMPLIAMVALKITLALLMNNLNNIFAPDEDVHYPPPAKPILNIPACKIKGCKTVVYNNDISSPYIDSAIKIMMQLNGLAEDDSLKVDSLKELDTYMKHNPSTAVIGFDFSLSLTNYTIFVNDTRDEQTFKLLNPSHKIQIQQSLDNAFIALQVKNTSNADEANRYFKAQTRDAPHHRSPFDFSSIIAQIGQSFYTSLSSTLIFVALCYAWIVHVNNVCTEKEKNLRFSLTMNGMRNYLYHFSWLIHVEVVIFVSVLILVASGCALQLPSFLKVDQSLLIVFYFFVSQVWLGYALLIISLFGTSRIALIFSYGFVALNIFLIVVISNMILLMIISGVDKAWFTLYALPGFHFSKIQTELSHVTTGSEAEYYTWLMFFGKIRPKGVPAANANFTAPYINCLLMLPHIVVCVLLSWFFDNVLPSSCNGVPRPIYFMFTPSYWGIRSETNIARRILEDRNKLRVSSTFIAQDPSIDQDVRAQIVDAVTPSENEQDKLMIIQLAKTFKKVQAVKSVSLTAERGTCLSILGHNGAGKTTTMNALIGLVEPTSGTALLLGHDIRFDRDLIRRKLGMCPQHDLLYDQLTILEHCSLYMNVKGLSNSDRINSVLTDVILFDVRHKKANELSGGMKRRLSLAISLMGDPDVLMMDEPTTGLDPKSRRLIWDLIHREKKNKLVLLTTHSMEEAEKLSDKIAIMAFGEVKVVGNSLTLKNRFGGGYNLQAMVPLETFEQENEHGVMAPYIQPASVIKINDVKNTVLQHQGATLVSENAGSLMFNFANQSMQQLIPVVRQIEQKVKSGTVRDWSLGQTTLEEVYLRVTKSASFGFDSESHSA